MSNHLASEKIGVPCLIQGHQASEQQYLLSLSSELSPNAG